MSGNGIVNIHGKEYMTVAKRLELAHKDGIDAIATEVLQHAPVVVIKATVTIKGGKTFTGISSANPSKAIEKSNPYEVAETSAVGRALGMANYGIIEGIASADEMAKAGVTEETEQPEEPTSKSVTCETCGAEAVDRKGTTKGGKPYHGIFCSTDNREHTKWIWDKQ